MDPASIEDITFLARSEHRIAVLDALTEAPRARHELRELTGTSRPTVNRVLDLEDRGWIDRQNGRCEPPHEARSSSTSSRDGSTTSGRWTISART